VRSDSPVRWRRLTWITYGNGYLCGRARFGEWSRHPQMAEGIDTFLHLDPRQLIAKDAFEWLWLMRAQGVKRLSACELLLAPQVAGVEWDSLAIRCHYKDRNDVWAMGNEQSLAMTVAHEKSDYELYFGRRFEPADCYFLIDSDQVDGDDLALSVDWYKLDQVMRDEIQGFDGLGVKLGRRTTEPYWFVASDTHEYGTGRADLPTLPADPRGVLAHSMLIDLVGFRRSLDWATHPKDEGNLYLTLNSRDLERLDLFHSWINSWIDKVQMLVASEPDWWPRFVKED
jgi:hypothetical protein